MAPSATLSTYFKSFPKDRNASCTHSHMTRLFDEYGCSQCSICLRRPSIGWLYRCTQDSAGLLPLSDFDETSSSLTRPEQDARIYTLSPSVSKAIGDGHYTEDEISKLVRQKEFVKQTILGPRPGSSSKSISTFGTITSLHESTTFSSLSTSISDDSSEDGRELYVKRPLSPISEARDDPELYVYATKSLAMPVQYQTPPSPCNFKVCQTCRPVYRDRAWASLNSVLNSPHQSPPQYELDNRRVSDVTIVKTLGELKCGSRQYALQSQEISDNRRKRSSCADFQDAVRKMLSSSQLFAPLQPQPEASSVSFDYRIRTFSQRTRDYSEYISNSDFSPTTSSSGSVEDCLSLTRSDTSISLHRGLDMLKSIQLPAPLTMSHLCDDHCSNVKSFHYDSLPMNEFGRQMGREHKKPAANTNTVEEHEPCLGVDNLASLTD